MPAKNTPPARQQQPPPLSTQSMECFFIEKPPSPPNPTFLPLFLLLCRDNRQQRRLVPCIVDFTINSKPNKISLRPSNLSPDNYPTTSTSKKYPQPETKTIRSLPANPLSLTAHFAALSSLSFCHSLHSAIHFPGLAHPGFEDCGSQQPEIRTNPNLRPQSSKKHQRFFPRWQGKILCLL